MEATSIMNHPAHTRTRIGDWVLLAEMHMEGTSHMVWHFNNREDGVLPEPTTHSHQEAKRVWIVISNQAGEDYVVHPGGYIQLLQQNDWNGYGNTVVNSLMEAVVEHSAH